MPRNDPIYELRQEIGLAKSKLEIVRGHPLANAESAYDAADAIIRLAEMQCQHIERLWTVVEKLAAAHQELREQVKEVDHA